MFAIESSINPFHNGTQQIVFFTFFKPELNLQSDSISTEVFM